MAEALATSVARRPPPDVIHLHDHVSLLLAKQLKATYHVPIVWDAHEIYEDLAAGSLEAARRNIEIIKENHRHADGFVTINESIAAFYRDNYPGLPEPCVVMNATRRDSFPKYDGRLHNAADLPRDQKILLFQGGFGPKRGLPQLIRAATNLREIGLLY